MSGKLFLQDFNSKSTRPFQDLHRTFTGLSQDFLGNLLAGYLMVNVLILYGNSISHVLMQVSNQRVLCVKNGAIFCYIYTNK